MRRQDRNRSYVERLKRQGYSTKRAEGVAGHHARRGRRARRKGKRPE